MNTEKPGEPLATDVPVEEGGANDTVDPHITAVASGLGDQVARVLMPKFKQFNEIGYFHVDDSKDWQNNVQTALSRELGIEHRVGASTSAQGAIREIEALVRQKQSIDVIVLDQSFFVYEGDDVADSQACREFLNSFAKLLEQPDAKEALKDTMIIMYSGTASTEFLQEMQKICPRVKALANKAKGGERMAATAAVQLADSGVVNPDDEKVRLARELLSKPMP